MYYQWKSDLRTWRNTTLEAKLEPFQPRWFDIRLWSCVPVAASIPLLTFSYPGKAPRSDLIWSASTWEPYSSRLRGLLRSLGVKFEEFPCRLVDRRTQDVLSEDYAVVHFLGCDACVDQAKSTCRIEKTPEGNQVMVGFQRIVVTDECVRLARPIVRLEESPRYVLAHERTRVLLAEHGVTGVRFIPLDKVL